MMKQRLISRPVLLLHAEALCFLVASCGAYHFLFPHHWVLFACLFLVPDLSLLTYFRGPTVAGSVVYNVMHSYALPCVVGILAALLHNTLLGELSLIWTAHISIDRMLGYGLKYPASFKFTHIQSTANPAIDPAV
jgi:hypothetical protein